MRVWIDTDIGSDVDDALALGYALRHPDIEVVGVSTVFGDVALRTRIAAVLLERAGASQIPVITGLGAPLTPGRDGRMFGHEGIGLLDDPQPRMVTTSDDDPGARIDALAQAVEAARPDALVAIGPLTNVAALSDVGAPLPPLTVMGGKTTDILLPGMIPQVPEWNWYCDPVAVQRVLERAQTPPRIVPAEVTFKTQLEREDIVELGGGDELAHTLSALCEVWLEALRDRLGSKHPRVALHDPLAVATLVAPEFCSFRECRVRIDGRGGTEHVAGGARIDVAGDVDNTALRAHLVATWLGAGNR
jgi:inosine-uridine nucleoside N-ribohydrolase